MVDSIKTMCYNVTPPRKTVKKAKKENKKVEILNTRKVKSSSPGMWHVAIDAKVTF